MCFFVVPRCGLFHRGKLPEPVHTYCLTGHRSHYLWLLSYAFSMSPMDNVLRITLAIFLALLPHLSLSHPGGVDKQGGHLDRQTGRYHCHRDDCKRAHEQQHKAEQEAREEGRAFSTLYDRDQWPHWTDDDHDCQDTRAETLIQTSQTAVAFSDPRQCTVTNGRWYDPYTDRTFTRARSLDIDHIVPLRHAHGHGADRWSKEQRQQFANDPQNLLAISARANRSKGASSPDQWLPPNQAFWCEYGRRWQALKQRYALMITPPEQEALERLAATCPAL